MQRLVLFSDWDHWVAQRMVAALLELLEHDAELRVVGVCVPGEPDYRRQQRRHVQRKAASYARALFFQDWSMISQQPPPRDLAVLTRRHDVDTVIATDANDPEFLSSLERHLAPDVAISIFWKRRFKPTFLQRFSQALNYHNGSVPDYRGLRATPWSIYRGEASSGFTFHRINTGLDLGNVLVTGSVSIDRHSTVYDVERRKTDLAIRMLPQVLDAIRRGLPGTPQQHTDRYNDSRRIETLRRIDVPGEVSSAEIRQRIRCFGPVLVMVDGDYRWLTGIGAADPRASEAAIIQLSDGRWRLKRSDRIAHRWRQLRAGSMRRT